WMPERGARLEARGARIPGVFARRATPPTGMPRPAGTTDSADTGHLAAGITMVNHGPVCRVAGSALLEVAPDRPRRDARRDRDGPGLAMAAENRARFGIRR